MYVCTYYTYSYIIPTYYEIYRYTYMHVHMIAIGGCLLLLVPERIHYTSRTPFSNYFNISLYRTFDLLLYAQDIFNSLHYTLDIKAKLTSEIFNMS